MARQDKDDEREERIGREILVDAHGPEEQALGWYTYLADTLHFPFTAHCVARCAISPLEPGDEFDIVGIAPEEECRHEMFVMTRWRPHELAVPLMQVEGVHVDEETQQAIRAMSSKPAWLKPRRGAVSFPLVALSSKWPKSSHLRKSPHLMIKNRRLSFNFFPLFTSLTSRVHFG